MAFLIREADSALTPVQHSNKIFTEHLKLMSLFNASGQQGSGMPIVMDFELKGKAGETVVHHFIPHAYASPLRGQKKTIIGNENSTEEFKLEVKVNEVNFPFRKKGKMTDQRLIYSARAEMSRQITNHFAQYNEDQLFKVMSGIDFEDDDQTAWEAATDTNDRVSGASRCIRADGANGATEVTSANSDNVALVAAMSSTDTMSPYLIESAAVMVRTADATSNDSASSVTNTYKMHPIRIGKNNEEFFILYVSLEVAKTLRFNADWLAHVYALDERGLEDSAIASGALGVWGNVIVKPSERIIRISDGSGGFYYRNLLLGADAVFSGWVQTLDYTEELWDHERELSSNGSEIRGEKKITFNGVDCGVAQVITAA